jgi:hypothetical protein
MLRPNQGQQLRNSRQRKPRLLSAFQDSRRHLRRKKCQSESQANDLGMKPVCLGERLDGLVRSVAEALRPGMGANDGLEQTLIGGAFRAALAFHNGCSTLRPAGPSNSDFPSDTISTGGTGECYNQFVAGNDDSLKRADRERCAVGILISLVRLEGGENVILEFSRRDARHRAGFGLPSPQQGRTDIEAIADAVFTGKTWTHEIPAIVVKLTHQEGSAFRAP